MTTRTTSAKNDPVIEGKADLISVFAKGEKPRDAWRIGTEHEKFVYRSADHRAPAYDEPGGILALLNGLTRFGWAPVYEGNTIIALSGPDGSVSLEPAGQFELSGAPLENLHQTCAETGRHLKQVKEVGDALGLGFLGLGPQNPSTPEWGTMLTDVNDYLQAAPFLAIIPGVAIVLSVLGFNLVGDGLREALDPKLRDR